MATHAKGARVDLVKFLDLIGLEITELETQLATRRTVAQYLTGVLAPNNGHHKRTKGSPPKRNHKESQTPAKKAAIASHGIRAFTVRLLLEQPRSLHDLERDLKPLASKMVFRSHAGGFGPAAVRTAIQHLSAQDKIENRQGIWHVTTSHRAVMKKQAAAHEAAA